jgi:hypothetical protein
LHLGDYLRVLYRRRWTAGLALLVVFVYGAFSTLKKTAIYEATAQVLIEKEARRATSLNSVLEQGGTYYDDDFYQTQYRVLQSRTSRGEPCRRSDCRGASARIWCDGGRSARTGQAGVLDTVSAQADALCRPTRPQPR